MKTLIMQNEKYSIYKVGREYLREIAKFTVDVNYRHHKEPVMSEVKEQEIEFIYKDELLFAKASQIYVAENIKRQMIGSIRIMKWNQKNILPTQKIFDINPLNHINGTSQSSYWHVGRFAVETFDSVSNISLFKTLMMYAIYPIYNEHDGYMIAECDSRLLRVMNLLGIDTVNLSESIHYLGSETIPIYADKEGLKKFYRKHHHLCDYEPNNVEFYKCKVG